MSDCGPVPPRPSARRRGAPLLPVAGADTQVPLVPAGRAALRQPRHRGQRARRWRRSAAGSPTRCRSTPASTAAPATSPRSRPRSTSPPATPWRSFVGARADDVCVFTRNTTDSLNLLAGCVPAGDAVLVLDCEHHADLLPWQRRGPVARPADAADRDRDAAGPGRRAGPRPLRAGGRHRRLQRDGGVAAAGRRRRPGARGGRAGGRRRRPARPAPARSPSPGSGADYVAFSGHKLYAPFGTGALVGRRDWLDAGPAYLAGGGAVQEVTVEETTLGRGAAPARGRLAERARRGRAGRGLRRARRRCPPARSRAHERALRERLEAGLARARRRPDPAHLGRLGRADRRRQLHRGRRRPGSGGRLPVRRARHRRARRPVLRAPAARPAGGSRGCAAGQRRRRHDRRRRRPAGRRRRRLPARGPGGALRGGRRAAGSRSTTRARWPAWPAPTRAAVARGAGCGPAAN